METLQGSRTAVYASSFADDYARMAMKDPDMAAPQTGTGLAPSMLSNRISWFFDIHGPSVYVDTACSSSLVALDMACQAMRSGNATAVCLLLSLSTSTQVQLELVGNSYLGGRGLFPYSKLEILVNGH